MRRSATGARFLLLGSALLALSACRQEPPPPLAGSQAGGSPAAPVEAPRLDVTPAASCEDREVVTVRWNAALVADGPVEVRVDNPARTLFATVASAGSKDTGVWARRGMAFIAVTPGGEIRARTVVEGPDGCE